MSILNYVGKFELPNLMFGGGIIESHPYRGLLRGGPYKSTSSLYNEIAILHQQENYKEANKVMQLLKEGVPPFFPKGFNHIFRLDRQIEIESYQIKSFPEKDPEQTAEAFLEKFSENGHSGRFPLIIIEKTPRGTYPSVYYQTKQVFLERGFITQMLTLQTIMNENTLKWSIFPLAIQIFTKMGGVPYVLYDEIKVGAEVDVCFLVGVGLSKPIFGRDNQNYIGFALLFGPNGEWRIMKTHAEAYEKEKLPKIFKRLVFEISSEAAGYVETSFRHKPHSIGLIIHYSGKNVSTSEEQALWEAVEHIKSVKGIEVKPYILKVNDSRLRASVGGASPCIDKTGLSTGLVPVGSVYRMNPQTYILFTLGCLDLGQGGYRATGSGTPTPIIVSIKNVFLEDGQELEKTLLKSVFEACCMNYTSINNPVNRLPITVKYAREIAYLLNRVRLDTLPQGVAMKPWFI